MDEARMDDASIEGFVAGLDSAADFATPRTSVAAHVPRLLAARREGVEVWAREARQALVDHVLADPQALLGSAILQTRDACRVADQGCCEEVGWFLDRVAREARRLSQPSVAAVVPDPSADGMPFERYEVLNLSRTVYITRLRWYAETRAPGAAAAFAGTVELDGDAPRVIHAWPALPSEAGVLGRVLRGHPDRQRYRLRRDPAR